MNKMLLGSNMNYYSQYDNIKLEESTSAMYSDASFYAGQASFPLPTTSETYASTKPSIALSPSSALCSMDPPTHLPTTSSSSSSSSCGVAPSSGIAAVTTSPMSLPSSSAHLLNDMIKSNDPVVFYSNFYSPMNASPEKQDQQQDQQSHFQHQSQQPQPQPPTQQQQQQQIKQHDIPNQHQRKKQRRQGSTSSKPLTSSASPVLTTTPTISTSGTTTHDDRSFMGFNMTTPHLSSETEYDLDSSTSPTASPTTTPLTEGGNDTGNSTTEIRRQIHIQSEQKRRAQIKCGFEDLRNELPTCLNKKMSKVALLHRTVQHIQHLKSTQISILAELERLVQENEQLKRFQQSVLQNQVMYQIQ